MQNTFDGLWHKHTSYSVGEELFGLEHTEQAGLNLIKKELNLLQRLYKLYNDVIDSVNGYFKILWCEVDVEEINNQLMDFGNRSVSDKETGWQLDSLTAGSLTGWQLDKETGW